MTENKDKILVEEDMEENEGEEEGIAEVIIEKGEYFDSFSGDKEENYGFKFEEDDGPSLLFPGQEEEILVGEDGDFEFSFGDEGGDFGLDDEDPLSGMEDIFEMLEDDFAGGGSSLDDLLSQLAMTQEQVEKIVDHVNEEIMHYNLMQDSINYRTISIYTGEYESTTITNQQRTDIDAGYTKSNLEALERTKAYVEKSMEEDNPVILSRLTRELHNIQDTLYRVLEKDINDIVLNSEEVMSREMEINNKEDKEILSSTLEKIISAFRPKIRTEVQVQKHDSKELKKAQTKLRNRRALVPTIEKDNIEAMYEIISITEITDEGTTLSESRHFMEIRARRIYDADINMPMSEFEMKYKDEINLRVPVEKAELVAYKIANKTVMNNYQMLTKDLNLTPKDVIIKPIVYKYKQSIITFPTEDVVQDFIDIVEDDLASLTRERKNSDLVVGISAGSRNYEGRFKRNILEKKPTYPRYTEAEIEDRLNKMMIDESMRMAVESTPHGSPNEQSISMTPSKKAYHSFETPTRSFLKSALTDFEEDFTITTDNKQGADNLKEIFEKNKEEIASKVLIESFTYLKTLKKSIESDMLDKTSVTLNYAMVADILTFGGEEVGFVDKYLKDPILETYIDEVTGKEMQATVGYNTKSLGEFLNNSENINKLTFGDIFGENKIEYQYRTNFNTLKHNRNNKVSVKVDKALDNLDIEIGVSTKQKNKIKGEGTDLESVDIKIGAMDEGVEPYLRTVIDKVVTSNGLDSEISEEDKAEFIKIYRGIMEPSEKGMKEEQMFSNPIRTNTTPTESLVMGSEEIRTLLLDVNEKVATEGKFEENYIDFVRSERLSEILGTSKWETTSLKDTVFLEDFIKIAPLVGIIEDVESIIYSALEKLDTNSLETEYEEGLFLKLVGLPYEDMEINKNPTTYKVGMEKLDRVLDIKDLINNHPIPIMRDITFFNNIISNKGYMRRISRVRGERKAEVIGDLIKRVMSVNETDDIRIIVGESEYNTNNMIKYVEKVLKSVSYSNIDYTMLVQSIQSKRFYQSRTRAQQYVQDQLDDYYYDLNEIEGLVDIRDMIYWVETVGILPIKISMDLIKEYQNEMEELKERLQRKAQIEGSVREIKATARKMNAYYKSYLKTADPKFLNNVDRDYVDFELLTQLPTIESPGGEYNLYELIEKYEVEDNLEDLDDGERYLELVLLIEKYHPNLKNELPLSIINHIEEGITTQVTNKEVIEMLKGDTKFNLNYKSV